MSTKPLLLQPATPSPQSASLAGLRTLVVGLGRFGGGVGVTQWLASEGAKVTVTDQADAASLAESLEAIKNLPVQLALGGHDACDLTQTDLVIINPAVDKRKSALFAEILRRNFAWTTEINLFCERCPAPVIAVTGSYGKSTTSAMLAHVLASAGDDATPRSSQTLERGVPMPPPLPSRRSGASRIEDPPRVEGDQGGSGAGISAPRSSRVHLGGNIGRSLLLELPNIAPGDVVVLEMSNAQLEDIGRIRWEPAIAVITNLFPHHLDRYENFEGYVQAKLNLVRAGHACFPVVYGEMHPQAQKLLEQAASPPTSTSPLATRHSPPIHRLVPLSVPQTAFDLSIPGAHNQINAACVATVCALLGLDEMKVRDSLKSFRGLPHRLEYVGEFNGVTYINDSKSTAPAATIIAIEAIMGGRGSSRTATTRERAREGEAPAEPLDAQPPYEPAAPVEDPPWGGGSPKWGEGIAVSPSPHGRGQGEGRHQSKIDNRQSPIPPSLLVIVGGQKKDVDLSGCAKVLAQNCRVVICYGQAGPAFANALQSIQHSAFSVQHSIRVVATLPDAVAFARSHARPGDTVLFSPGAPSFDLYANFTDRGKHFVSLVLAQ